MSDSSDQVSGGMAVDPVRLTLFGNRVNAICDEMGTVLRQAALSPNIRERLDFSCALFDAGGALFAQAAHIPVHLGSMAFAMGDIVAGFDWAAGDVVVVNDPFLGGTHLPDVTLIEPVFVADELVGFAANRAHHANIGAVAPGSMPVASRLEDEGIVIPPTRIVRGGQRVPGVLAGLDRLHAEDVGGTAHGDFAAQISANRAGVRALAALVQELGAAEFAAGLAALNDYGERLARATIGGIGDGEYAAVDYLDDDGFGNEEIEIRLRVEVRGSDIRFDFAGTAAQVAGNVNCPLSVTAAAVFYLLRCLMPQEVPNCAGVFRPIRIAAPAGCLVNAQRPAAVAAGNVETSQRLVDVVSLALAAALPERIPAAAQGTMNNLAMGARGSVYWDYYETLAGGLGAHAAGDGVSAVQAHMTNTLNTPIESVEAHYPLRVLRYGLRRGSGGAGRYRGGDGLVRSFEFLQDTEVTLLTERRRRGAWGLAGGGEGLPGVNRLNGERVGGKCSLQVRAGDRLTIETPGGGGWGSE